MFKPEDKYKNFIKVCESPNILTWAISIIIFPLFFECIRIHKLHKKILGMGKREQWLYQKALNDNMTRINLDTACAFSYNRITNYRFDIPKELARKDEYVVF